MYTTWLEVDLYSGRPNPSGKLSESKWQRLVELLNTMKTKTPISFPDGLGYRGLVITHNAPVTSPPVILRIYHGTIQRQAGAEITYLTDPEKQVVRLLLDAAKQWLDDEVVRLVVAEEHLS